MRAHHGAPSGSCPPLPSLQPTGTAATAAAEPARAPSGLLGQEHAHPVGAHRPGVRGGVGQRSRVFMLPRIPSSWELRIAWPSELCLPCLPLSSAALAVPNPWPAILQRLPAGDAAGVHAAAVLPQAAAAQAGEGGRAGRATGHQRTRAVALLGACSLAVLLQCPPCTPHTDLEHGARNPRHCCSRASWRRAWRASMWPATARRRR